MITEVNKYRGWSISFNTESEKFTAYSNHHDKEVEKGSYSAIKKSIDEFILENTSFKPFYITRNFSSYGYNVGKEKIKVIGIRKDGFFTYEDEMGKKHLISGYNEKDYMLVLPENEPLIKKYYDEVKRIEQLTADNYKFLKDNLKEHLLIDYKKELGYEKS